MALKTLGTNANNSLSAFLVGTDDVIAANVALLLNGVKFDMPFRNGALVTQPRNLVPGAYAQKGSLWIPNRGQLQVQDGDWIAFDPTTGWPILISADCAANGAITHS